VSNVFAIGITFLLESAAATFGENRAHGMQPKAWHSLFAGLIVESVMLATSLSRGLTTRSRAVMQPAVPTRARSIIPVATRFAACGSSCFCVMFDLLLLVSLGIHLVLRVQLLIHRHIGDRLNRDRNRCVRPTARSRSVRSDLNKAIGAITQDVGPNAFGLSNQ